MKARPILMHARSIQNLLAGRKTQTRRIVKLPHQNPLGAWEPTTIGGDGCRDAQWNPFPKQVAIWHTRTGDTLGCPYGVPGDLLWVRETFVPLSVISPATDKSNEWGERPFLRRGDTDVVWRADGPVEFCDGDGFSAESGSCDREDLPRWKPSIHMPRAASRLTLRLTDVRVERVQDCSETDALAEGIVVDGEPLLAPDRAARRRFQELWDHTNGPGAWDRNDWCWALTFEVLRENVDRVLERAKAPGQ